jgi:hypothetical protein
MTYSGGAYGCGAAGIEDSTGQDGLAYVKFCDQAPSNKAVRFYRPAPSARAGVKPAYQGRFTHVGEAVSFQVPIRNTGQLGADTYDVLFTSTWPVTLYAADGTAPLSDTDGDGAPDTGLVAPGGSATFVARVSTPAVVNVGDRNIVSATVRSSLNTGISRIVTLQTAVPAPFAQIWRDDANGAMALYLVQPDSQVLRKTTPDGYYGDDMAVAEMPSSFAYVWGLSHWTGSMGYGDIEYTLLDRNGSTVRAPSKLTDHSAATVSTYDNAPAVAVASNGHVGVIWYRYLYNDSTGQFNYNIFFAILGSAGNLLYGPANLTNNTAWGRWDDLNVPQFYNPRIAATADDRFVLAWGRQS